MNLIFSIHVYQTVILVTAISRIQERKTRKKVNKKKNKQSSVRIVLTNITISTPIQCHPMRQKTPVVRRSFET